MPFVAYEKNGLGDRPSISIRTNGRVGLNKEARDILGENAYVVLYINKEESQIGIKPVSSDKVPGARFVRKPQRDAFFLALDFLEEFDLKRLISKRLPCKWDKATGMLVASYPANSLVEEQDL